jgi:hypothetical protein
MRESTGPTMAALSKNVSAALARACSKQGEKKPEPSARNTWPWVATVVGLCALVGVAVVLKHRAEMNVEWEDSVLPEDEPFSETSLLENENMLGERNPMIF